MTTLDVAVHQPYIHRRRAQEPRRSLKAARWHLPTLSAACCGTAPSRAGTRATISQRRRQLPASTWPQWMRLIAADPDRYEQVIAGNEHDHAAIGPLGRADFRFRKRAVLRPGPHRPLDLADGKQGFDASIGVNPRTSTTAAFAGGVSQPLRQRAGRKSPRFCRILLPAENPSAKNRSATSPGRPRIKPSRRTAATSSE